MPFPFIFFSSCTHLKYFFFSVSANFDTSFAVSMISFRPYSRKVLAALVSSNPTGSLFDQTTFSLNS